MVAEWFATPVPLWLLLVVGLFLFVIGIAVNRKFSVTSGWLAILGTLFTPNDIKALAVLLWRSNVIPQTMKDLRFGGDETNFANYFADMVLKFLPEIGKVEQTLNSMMGGAPTARDLEAAPVGIYERLLHLEGRGHVKFLDPPIPDSRPRRDERPGWPLIDRPVEPPVKLDP